MYRNVDQNMSDNVAEAMQLLQQAETLEVSGHLPYLNNEWFLFVFCICILFSLEPFILFLFWRFFLLFTKTK